MYNIEFSKKKIKTLNVQLTFKHSNLVCNGLV